jgi:hypothetical protein
VLGSRSSNGQVKTMSRLGKSQGPEG